MEEGSEFISKYNNKNLENKTTMLVSYRLLVYLEKHGLKNESHERTIWRLLGQKQLTREQKQDLKTGYEKLME